MKVAKIIILGLATFRITELITKDEGPHLTDNSQGMFKDFRSHAGRKASSGNLLWRNIAEIVNCPYCTGIYIGFLVLLLPFWITVALAVSGVQSIIQTVVPED